MNSFILKFDDLSINLERINNQLKEVNSHLNKIGQSLNSQSEQEENKTNTYIVYKEKI